MARYDSAIVSNSNRNSRKFSDIDLDFTRNQVTSDVVSVEDVVAVKRSVKNLLQTGFYERPFQPELGCGIRELLFENFTPMTKVFLQKKIEEVLNNYEPRINLNSVRVDDDQDNNRLVVDIYFYVIGVPGPQQVQTFLQRKIEEVLINYEPRIELQNVAVDDDQDNNRLVVDIYFYIVGVSGPQVVQTFLQRVR